VTLVAEALDGLGVIQAYQKQQYFTDCTSQCVDDAHRALFGAECLNLWLAFYCDFFGAAMVLAVACFGIGQWKELGSSNVGLAFSQSIQMLVFYTWSIRLLADTIGLFGSAEKLAWLANHTPQEGGRLASPALRGSKEQGKAAASTVGVKLVPQQVRRWCCWSAGASLLSPCLAMPWLPSAGYSGATAVAASSRPLVLLPCSCQVLTCPGPGKSVPHHQPHPACPPQPSDLAAGPKLPQGWPCSGSIVFDQVVMKYAPHLPPALKNVTFDIKSSEKVGVVGRTGSGKSTLLLALYRMFDLESGSITLDGMDISTLTLNQLRNGLSVIPQEPVVFSGTVRSNLDPFGEKSHDGELWQALRDCGLEDQVGPCCWAVWLGLLVQWCAAVCATCDGTVGAAAVGSDKLHELLTGCLVRSGVPAASGTCCGITSLAPFSRAFHSHTPLHAGTPADLRPSPFSCPQAKASGGLDGRLDGTGGQAWSLGQQQLMCLARAHLKKVPVLCLDEATAAMDPHTEAHVLEIIERLFADRTTFTIAHRLDNVIRSDQVIVMDAGMVAEIGPPSVLLADPNSAFSSLVDRTGEAGAAALRQMAADFFEERARGQEVGSAARPNFDLTRTSMRLSRTSMEAATKAVQAVARRASLEGIKRSSMELRPRPQNK
jgi:ABC-type multidrug transport system fused ATPase/permease subunit